MNASGGGNAGSTALNANGGGVGGAATAFISLSAVLRSPALRHGEDASSGGAGSSVTTNGSGGAGVLASALPRRPQAATSGNVTVRRQRRKDGGSGDKAGTLAGADNVATGTASGAVSWTASNEDRDPQS